MFGHLKAEKKAPEIDTAAPNDDVTETASPIANTQDSNVEPEENFGEMAAAVNMPSVDGWAADIVLSFLNLMDIENVNDRRKALLALEMGKKEEDIVAVLKIADSYLFLLQKYYEANLPDDAAIPEFSIYLTKSAAMKNWLGI